MTIQQAGQALPNLPGLYVNVVPPQNTFLSPAETDILGIVGTAIWGPVDAPTNVGGLTDYATKFGNPQNRLYDMGTPVWTANLQGAQNFRCVRVTDSTDVAATAPLGIVGVPTKVAAGTGYVVGDTITYPNGAILTVASVTGGGVTTWTVTQQPTAETAGTLTQTATSGIGTGATFSFAYTSGMTATGKYTGSLGNSVQVSLAPGNQIGTWKATVYLPGVGTEVFNNIGLGLTGTVLWAAIVAAINSGNAIRGASNIIVATAGSASTAPTSQTVTLTGGLDGASGVTATALIGIDTSPRTGMYALRSQGCSVGVLSDCSAPTSWAAQVAFGLSEGVYMIGITASGDTISDAVTNKSSEGIDSYSFKLLFGDWCYFNDTINGAIRVVSPQGFVAGWKAAWEPQFSALNQQLLGIVGTQKTATNTVYQTDDLVTLNQAGFDVITNPSVGGAYFSCRLGHNSSSNPAIRGDNYTTMTNFIAATLNQGLGPFVGQLQSPTVQANALATLNAFFNDLWTQGAIGSSNPAQVPWAATISNNPAQVASGQMIANTAVIFLSVIEEFITNVQGGQTVTIPSGNPQPQQLAA